jgi:hypothetical protein
LFTIVDGRWACALVERDRILVGSWRVEFRDHVIESSSEARIVLAGVGASKLGDFAVTICRQLIFPPGLVYHPEPVIAVVNFRESNE